MQGMEKKEGCAMSYRVVEEFEAELCRYTGARFAVTTNSCTMAILLACARLFDKKLRILAMDYDHPGRLNIEIPCRTYASVPMAVIHAGGAVRFVDIRWRGEYRLGGLNVWDSARRFTSGMYSAGQFQCVSFQTSKILGLEQGGAILHDNAEADTWLRRARFDGRLNAEEKLPAMIGWHCYLNPSTAALGLQRLACLPRDNPDQAGSADFADLSELPCFR